MEFVNLIEDVLLHIFSFLDPVDLYSIQCLDVHKLTQLVEFTMKRCSGSILMTGNKCFSTTNNTPIADQDRLRVHSNWINGKFTTITSLFQDPFKHVGRMRMDRDYFYVSNKGELRMYQRLNDGTCGDQFASFGDPEDEPIISTMELSGEHLFTGTYYGTCSYFRSGTQIVSNQKVHEHYKDILAMEASREILATSNFREIKLFRVNDSDLDIVAETDCRARCMKLDGQCEKLIVGNICTDFHGSDGFITTLNALSLYDTNTMIMRSLRCSSQGVVDIVWHSSSHVVLCGHWNGDLRMFDLRTDSDELTIAKTGAQDINVSLQYDGIHGVLCGFRSSSEVCLYDLRKAKGPVRSYGQFQDPELSRKYLVDVLADSNAFYVVNCDGVQICDFSSQRK